jgi:hypothetical protein
MQKTMLTLEAVKVLLATANCAAVARATDLRPETIRLIKDSPYINPRSSTLRALSDHFMKAGGSVDAATSVRDAIEQSYYDGRD